MAVVAFHAASFTGLIWGFDGATGAVGPWVQHLDVGVSVFFVLSAFLLYRPFVISHLGGAPAPATGVFLVRRLVRILPAYWVALAVAAHVLGQVDLGDWWGHLRFYSLTQIYWTDTVFGGLPQAWSLNTELSFYLALPLWAALVRRAASPVAARLGWGPGADGLRRVHLAGCALLYLGALAVRGALRGGGHSLGYAWLPATADLFAIGMALAVVNGAAVARGGPANSGARGPLRTLASMPAVSLVAALGCYSAVVALDLPYGFEEPSIGQELARQVLFGAVAALVVLPGVFGDQRRGAVRAVLRSRPLVALGIVSYGVYLWHITALIGLDRRWRPAGTVGFADAAPWAALAGGALAISVVVAAVSWFVVERPLMEQLRARQRPLARAPHHVGRHGRD